MRRGNGGGIRRTEDGFIESVNMGSDYTSEHEWGIKDLERHFALDKKAPPGVPRRTIHAIGRGLTLDEKEVIIGYPGRPWSDEPSGFNQHALTEIQFHPPFRDEPEAESQGAWSDGDFAVHFRKTEQGKQDAQDLWDAFQRLDIAFLFQNVGNNPFARSGLNLVIVSRLPKEIVDGLAEKDADHDALEAAAEATGIRARLDAASKLGTRDYTSKRGGYFALRPSWANDEKTEVKFWLNPTDQRANNAGWFTVADLDAWLEGKGPIPKGGES